MPTPSEIIAAHIRAKTLNALQDADEIGGPDRADYIHLMESIAKECLRRAETAREQDPQRVILRWAQKNINRQAELVGTGGGCTALQLPASSNGCYWWVTDNCSAPETMTADKATDDAFAVGLYAPEGDQWVSFQVHSMEEFKTLYNMVTDVALRS